MFEPIVRCCIINAPTHDSIFEKGSVVEVNLLDGSVFRHSRKYPNGTISAVTCDGGWYDFEPLSEEERPNPTVSSGVRSLTPDIASYLLAYLSKQLG